MKFKYTKLIKSTLLLASFAGTPAFAGDISADPEQAKKDIQLAQDWLDGRLDSYGDYKVTYDGEPIVMRFSSHIPEVSKLAQLQLKTFDVLNKMSEGKIKVQAFWSATLHAADQGRESVAAGVTDAAPCFATYHARDYELAGVSGLPFLYRNTTEGVSILSDVYPKYLKEEFEKYGVKLLRIQINNTYNLYNNKGVRTLEDMQGLKVRSGGGTADKIINALGGVAVSMPATDAYSALQGGTLDAIHFSDVGAKIFRINEVAKYRTVNGFNTASLEYCLSPAWFDALPEDLKDVVDRWAQQASMAEAIIAYDYGGALDVATMEAAGLETIVLSVEEVERWKKAVAGVEAEWIEEKKQKGLPGGELVAKIKELGPKYQAMSPSELLQDVIDNPRPGLRN